MDETQKRFVNQRRRLQRMPGAFAVHLPMRQPSQFGIHERRQLMQRVAEAYVPYMNAMLEFHERQSQTLLGYEIKQILLVHANPLNADHFGKLIAMMKKRGYQFISLTEALTDKAYQTYDGYTGRSETSWLQRWAMTQKHQPTRKRAARLATYVF